MPANSVISGSVSIDWFISCFFWMPNNYRLDVRYCEFYVAVWWVLEAGFASHLWSPEQPLLQDQSAGVLAWGPWEAPDSLKQNVYSETSSFAVHYAMCRLFTDPFLKSRHHSKEPIKVINLRRKLNKRKLAQKYADQDWGHAVPFHRGFMSSWKSWLWEVRCAESKKEKENESIQIRKEEIKLFVHKWRGFLRRKFKRTENKMKQNSWNKTVIARFPDTKVVYKNFLINRQWKSGIKNMYPHDSLRCESHKIRTRSPRGNPQALTEDVQELKWRGRNYVHSEKVERCQDVMLPDLFMDYTTPTAVPASHFMDNDTLILRFVWKGDRTPARVNTVLGENEMGGLTRPDLGFCYKTAVITTVRYGQKVGQMHLMEHDRVLKQTHRNTAHWSRTQARRQCGGPKGSVTTGAGTTGHLHAKNREMTPGTNLTPVTTMSSQRIADLNVKHKTLKLLEGNRRNARWSWE